MLTLVLRIIKAATKKGNSLTTILIGVCIIMIFDTLSDAAASGTLRAVKAVFLVHW